MFSYRDIIIQLDQLQELPRRCSALVGVQQGGGGGHRRTARRRRASSGQGRARAVGAGRSSGGRGWAELGRTTAELGRCGAGRRTPVAGRRTPAGGSFSLSRASPKFLRARPLAREENDEARLGVELTRSTALVFAWMRFRLLDQKRTVIRGGRGTKRLAFSKSLDPSPPCYLVPEAAPGQPPHSVRRGRHLSRVRRPP
jgi:hypothetical protein